MSQSASFDQIRAVLYDMDGLIVDTEPIHFRAFRQYMRQFDIDLPESVMSDLIGYTELDNLRDLKREYALDTPLDDMAADRRAIYLDLVRTSSIDVFPGFWEFSADARQRGLREAVVSSAAADQVEAVLGRLFEGRADGPAGSYFDAIVTGDDIERNKPHPDIYLEGAKRLDVPPALCLALEDSPPGAESAASAGMMVVAVPNEYTHGLAFPGAMAVVESLHSARRYLSG